MNTELCGNVKKKKHVYSKMLAIIAVVTAALLLLSSCAANLTQINHKEDGRIVHICADDAKNIDIFTAEYKSATGETIIKSANGDSVITPGAKHNYTFRIKNDDQVAVDYTLKPDVEFIGYNKIPIEVDL